MIALASLLFFSTASVAVEFKKSEPEKTEIQNYFFICKNQKVVRTLRMDKKSPNCEAIYTKDGVDKVIGTAQKVFSCVDVLDRVKNNLSEAGWKCKEVKGEQITNKTDLPTETTVPESKKK